jgi:hypothetical protein
MNPVYDPRPVPAHDDKIGATVFLINEAPGPSEATSGIPSFGQQGANIFHALRSAGILWATAQKRFIWPKNGATEQSERHQKKAEFLKLRASYITCTNAFPQWPKPSINSEKFCPPREEDVVAVENIARIRNELKSTHRAILICGAHAYLACTGNSLLHPSTREASELNSVEVRALNERLQSNFEKGWYMGHTRRWSTKKQEVSRALRQLAQFLGWPLCVANTV